MYSTISIIPRHHSNDELDDSSTPRKQHKCYEDKINVTLTNDERDDLIREYQNRPQMWDPNVAGF